MSLFEEAAKERDPFGITGEKASKNDTISYLNQTSALLNILNAELSSKKISAKSATKFKGFRTRYGDCSWCLHQLQGAVTESVWQSNVEASIKGMLKTIQNSQPNGTWKVLEYDVKIENDKAGVERIFLVVKFIDAEDAADLQYANGMPSTVINVKSNPIPMELIEALSKKSGGDDELNGLLKQLIGVLGANALSVAEAPHEHKEEELTFNDEPAPLSFED
tara:strand:+ start:2513 stop:3175 length:663 start_codon:yes stop_codon:yes gene_type:complete